MLTFIASSERLFKGLQIANSAINPRVVMPILENFLFVINKNLLQVCANDLENIVNVDIEISSEHTGEICIPSKILLEYLKNIYTQPLTINVHEDYTIEIVSEKGRYKLKGEDPANFPKNPSQEGTKLVKLPAQALHQAIEKTLLSVGNDDVRPALTGILFELHPDGVRLVSTDAHRLVYYDINTIAEGAISTKAIVPKKAGTIIKNFLAEGSGENELAFSDKHLFLKHESVELISRLVDAEFPDYRNVIPQNNTYELRINKDELLSSVARLNVFSSKSTNMVILDIDSNMVKLSAQDNDFAREGAEEIDASYQGEGIKIAFNGQFLVEMLKSVYTEQVAIEMSAPQKPGIIFPLNDDGQLEKNHLMLVMPLII